jgi:hypothetical protein
MSDWNKFLYSLAAAALIALIACLGMFFYVEWVAASIAKETSTNLNTTMGVVFTAAENLNDSAVDLETTLSQEHNAFAGQLADSDVTLKKVNTTLDGVNELVANVNGDTLSARAAIDTLNDTIADQQGKLGKIEDQATADLGTFNDQEKQLGPLFAQGTIDLKDADALFVDPDISATFHHINATSASVDDGTAHVDAWVDRETAPVRGTWNVLKAFLMEFAGPAASVVTAAK